jgi:L-alanine-DL-glutamate epimerase-like enolase superfamily enzyme
VPIFHCVGGLDPLRPADVSADAPDDGLPHTLDEWIARDGVYCFKVKLRGRDIDWDLQRLIDTYRIGREGLDQLGHEALYLSADANEQCEHPDYMIELLKRLEAADPAAYEALLYIEQPTERDMRRAAHDMHPLAALKPVFIDESLTTLADMDFALEHGWSGVTLKTCKCHTLDLLIGARARAQNIPYIVQDLTNPGIALLQSVGLAGRLYPVLGVEANSRQYYPASSTPEAAVHPAICTIRGGVAPTATLTGPGFGFQVEHIERPIFAIS